MAKKQTFGIGDVVRFKTDRGSLKQLLHQVSSDMDYIIGMEEEVEENHENGSIELEGGDEYNENLLELVKKSDKDITKEEINQYDESSNQINDVINLKFISKIAYAELECGDRFKLDDLIRIGKTAEKYKKMVVKKGTTKKAVKKK